MGACAIMREFARISLFVCEYVCGYTFAFVSVLLFVPASVCVCGCMFVCASVCACVYVSICERACKYIYIYI